MHHWQTRMLKCFSIICCWILQRVPVCTVLWETKAEKSHEKIVMTSYIWKTLVLDYYAHFSHFWNNMNSVDWWWKWLDREKWFAHKRDLKFSVLSFYPPLSPEQHYIQSYEGNKVILHFILPLIIWEAFHDKWSFISERMYSIYTDKGRIH